MRKCSPKRPNSLLHCGLQESSRVRLQASHIRYGLLMHTHDVNVKAHVAGNIAKCNLRNTLTTDHDRKQSNHFSRAVSLRSPSFCLCIIVSTFPSHRFYCFLINQSFFCDQLRALGLGSKIGESSTESSGSLCHITSIIARSSQAETQCGKYAWPAESALTYLYCMNKYSPILHANVRLKKQEYAELSRAENPLLDASLCLYRNKKIFLFPHRAHPKHGYF